MSLSQNYPTTRPTLTLDFAKAKRVDPRVTFTRASTATYFDASGVLQSAANNVPRIDFDPATLLCNGLLIEEARTNLLLQSGLPNAVAGSPGTAPTGWNTGSVTGAPTLALATSIYGSAEQALTYSAASGERLWHQQTINVVDGTTYTYTAYCEASSGNTEDVLAVINGTSTRTIISTTALNPTGGAGVRVTVVFSVIGTGTVILRLGIGVNAPTIAAGSVTMSRPQCEAGSFPTSYIPTTTTALTRSADVASVTTLSPWFNASASTVYFEGTVATVSDSQNPYLWSISDNTKAFGAREQFAHTRNASSAQTVGVVAAGGVTNVSVASPNTAVAANTVFKAAASYAANDVKVCVNGLTPATTASATLPTGLNTLKLGAPGWSGAPVANAFYVRRLTYYPRSFSGAELQTLTA